MKYKIIVKSGKTEDYKKSTENRMITTHKIVFGNSNNMDDIPDSSVDLMVTWPPYPMIEMWDETFSSKTLLLVKH